MKISSKITRSRYGGLIIEIDEFQHQTNTGCPITIARSDVHMYVNDELGLLESLYVSLIFSLNQLNISMLLYHLK